MTVKVESAAVGSFDLPQLPPGRCGGSNRRPNVADRSGHARSECVISCYFLITFNGTMKMGCCRRLRNPVPKDTNEGVETISSVPSDGSMKGLCARLPICSGKFLPGGNSFLVRSGLINRTFEIPRLNYRVVISLRVLEVNRSSEITLGSVNISKVNNAFNFCNDFFNFQY